MIIRKIHNYLLVDRFPIYYLVLLILLTFSKEFIVLNAEFVVICAFITIFFIVKNILQVTIVRALDVYKKQIAETYVQIRQIEIYKLNYRISLIRDKIQYNLDKRHFYMSLANKLLYSLQTTFLLSLINLHNKCKDNLLILSNTTRKIEA